MKIIRLTLIVNLCLFLSCQCTTKKLSKKQQFEVAIWMGAKKEASDDYYQTTFSKLYNAGISDVLINTGGDPILLDRIVPIAKANLLNVHAWMFTLNRPGDSIALGHPDWYAVNRKGESCYSSRPYVDYYQWLCPSKPEAVNHILKIITELASIPNLSSVHLDYIRFVDIFLPVGLLPKYDLKQNNELPQYDYCYCTTCRRKFKAQHNRDPLKLTHPELDVEWKQFRLNAVKNVVDQAYALAHKKNKKLTAAVFPYPTMATNMVRQQWDKWDIDHVYPMIYHNFYNENLEWIKFATIQGLNDLKHKETSLSSGVYLPSITPSEIDKTIRMVYDSGAAGISFFDLNSLSDSHLQAIKSTLLQIKNGSQD